MTLEEKAGCGYHSAALSEWNSGVSPADGDLETVSGKSVYQKK